MRAVFTVEIDPTGVDSYPSDSDFLTRVRAYGLEETSIKQLPNEQRLERYKEHAEELWKDMPEVAQEEKAFVIFYGILVDNRTKFVITRMNESEATFRLLNPHLGRLQQSTARLVRGIVRHHANSKGLTLAENRIRIYERGHEEIIIFGRVIPSPFREIWNVDKKNLLLALVSLLLFIPTLIALRYVTSQTNLILGGTLERVSTTFLTSLIVSGVSLLQTYLQIKEEKLIDWKVASNTTPFDVD